MITPNYSKTLAIFAKAFNKLMNFGTTLLFQATKIC